MANKEMLAALVAREGAAQVRVERFGQIIGTGRSKAWELVKARRVRSVKVGRNRLVPLDAVVEFLASQEVA